MLATARTETPEARPLVVLAYWYPPVNESGAFRPARFCRYLPRFGYVPSVVAAPYDAAGSDVGVYRTPSRSPTSRLVAVTAAVSRAFQRVAPYSDELEWIPHAVEQGSRLLSAGSAGIVSTAPPVASHLAGAILRQRYEVPWVADFRDPLVGNPSRRRPHGMPYDRLLERWIVTRADVIVVNTDAVLDRFMERYPKHRDKLHLIWNGYDPSDDLEARPIPKRSHKVIAHVGTLYAGRHPSTLLDALARLLKSERLGRSDVKLRLVGSIHSEHWMAGEAFNFLSENGCVELTDGAVSRQEAQREMAEADYLLLLDLNEGLQVPAKIFEYVRIGRPILAFTPEHSPVQRVLALSGTPSVCIHPTDAPNEVDAKLMGLLRLPTEPTPMTPVFREQFDAVAQTEKLASLLDAAAARIKGQ